MTTLTPTPPCLGEREAVARTLKRIEHIRQLWMSCLYEAADAIIAQHIAPFRTENETLRAERDAAIARAEEARLILESLLTYFPDNGCVAHAQTSAAIRALTTPEHPHGD